MSRTNLFAVLTAPVLLTQFPMAASAKALNLKVKQHYNCEPSRPINSLFVE